MKMQPGRTWEARPALRQRSRPAFGQRRTCGRALVVVRGRESRPHGEGGQSDGSGTKRTTPEAGCMNPTRMAEKPMFPTHRSNPSDGEPDAVKVARPVRRGGMAQTSRSSPAIGGAVPTQCSDSVGAGSNPPALGVHRDPSAWACGSEPPPLFLPVPSMDSRGRLWRRKGARGMVEGPVRCPCPHRNRGGRRESAR